MKKQWMYALVCLLLCSAIVVLVRADTHRPDKDVSSSWWVVLDCRDCWWFVGQEIVALGTWAHAVQLRGKDIYADVTPEYFVLAETTHHLMPDWDFPVISTLLIAPDEDQSWTYEQAYALWEHALSVCGEICPYGLVSSMAFVSYRYMGDAQKASDLYARAALLPGAPSGAYRMPSLILSDMWEHEKALAMRELMIADETLPLEVREWAQEKIGGG